MFPPPPHTHSGLLSCGFFFFAFLSFFSFLGKPLHKETLFFFLSLSPLSLSATILEEWEKASLFVREAASKQAALPGSSSLLLAFQGEKRKWGGVQMSIRLSFPFLDRRALK